VNTPKPRKWQDHIPAALATFFGIPALGILALFVIEPMQPQPGSFGEMVQATAWMMALSFFVSWVLLPLAIPAAVFVERRFGPVYWLAIPVGAAVGLLIGLLVTEPSNVMLRQSLVLIGMMMAGLYCCVFRITTANRETPN
jgi:MFS family permease